LMPTSTLGGVARSAARTAGLIATAAPTATMGRESMEMCESCQPIRRQQPTTFPPCSALEGEGLAQVREPIRRTRLVHALERFAPMTPAVFLNYLGRRQILPELLTFIDHVKGQLVYISIRGALNPKMVCQAVISARSDRRRSRAAASICWR
jgi:hypothetical protein